MLPQELQTGLGDIDTQRGLILNLLDNFCKSDIKERSQALSAILAYTMAHIIDEELHMSTSGYPYIETHKYHHRLLKTILTEPYTTSDTLYREFRKHFLVYDYDFYCWLQTQRCDKGRTR